MEDLLFLLMYTVIVAVDVVVISYSFVTDLNHFQNLSQSLATDLNHFLHLSQPLATL